MERTVDGMTDTGAAWCCPRPSRAASSIAGHVAFWHGVRVEHVPDRGEGTTAAAGRGRAARVFSRLARPAGRR